MGVASVVLVPTIGVAIPAAGVGRTAVHKITCWNWRLRRLEVDLNGRWKRGGACERRVGGLPKGIRAGNPVIVGGTCAKTAVGIGGGVRRNRGDLGETGRVW